MLKVSHRLGEYEVAFRSLRESIGRLDENSFIITDTNVAGIYGSLLEGRRWFAIPAGEGSKDLATYQRVVAHLASSGANRKTVVVALGGGVVGDLAGFVAATFMRGVRLVQIPTSLLAMVDSSVGGKVGVDLPQGKNLVGAFLPPVAVEVPLEVLGTLPTREYVSGMAEVCKYGFIMDTELAESLRAERLSPESPACGAVVEACIRHKAFVVGEDEFETNGLRAILNFGHTVGHAIEMVTGFGPVLHGEAIAIGMRVEAELAERLGIAKPGVAQYVAQTLETQGLPVRRGLSLPVNELLEAMKRDKKRSGDGLPFSLVTEIGQCKLYTDIAEGEVAPLLDDL